MSATGYFQWEDLDILLTITTTKINSSSNNSNISQVYAQEANVTLCAKNTMLFHVCKQRIENRILEHHHSQATIFYSISKHDYDQKIL